MREARGDEKKVLGRVDLLFLIVPNRKGEGRERLEWRKKLGPLDPGRCRNGTSILNGG